MPHYDTPYPPALPPRPHVEPATHAPRFLFLYGSLRERSLSRLLCEEAARIAASFGVEARLFDPRGLPLFGDAPESHPRVQELRDLSEWSEAHVWCSPEQHGTITAVLKNQLDWIPLTIGDRRPAQGRALAVTQVTGGAQSFNAVNEMRQVGRWLRMFAIPSQSVVPHAHEHFHEDGTMRDSAHRDRVVDMIEELTKVTLLLRDSGHWLADRHSERRAAHRAGTAEPQ